MIPIYEANQENQLIDLRQYLIKNQPATIAVRCGNESMRDTGV
ncbi:hypothetical protein [Snodgrassella alvi]|jgi:DNA polymerase V|nr:hypothetical protein [Snodgrassella alvi]